MKNYKKIYAAFILVGGLILHGCNGIFDDLAINPNQPSMGAYFTSPSAVNDAVMTMYGYMSTQRCLGASGSKTTIIRSDEASSNSDYGKPGMFGADLNASYYTIEQPYTLMYTTASQASYIIETAPSVDFSGNEELRNAYMGEAYFWRAFAHYYLLINFRNISPIDKDGYTDIRMFSTMIFNDLDASIHLRNDAGGNPIRLKGPGGYKWEELYPAKNGKEGFATVSNPLAHPFKAGIRKGIDCSMPTQTEADGTPKLVGVGAGVKEYVYNQPRAHGVNWRYIRYADVLMMYAEAVVSGGTQASDMTPLQAVNKVRGRANLSELPSVTMADIQNERILEFALEGHRCRFLSMK